MVGFWVIGLLLIKMKIKSKMVGGGSLFIFYWLKLDLNPCTLIPKHDFHPSTQSEKVTNRNREKTEN